MAGIYPASGVPFTDARNAVDVPVVTGCAELFFSTSRCTPRFDPAAANAVISEILNVGKSAGLAYDCGRLDNLSLAIQTMIAANTPALRQPVLVAFGAPGAFSWTCPPGVFRIKAKVIAGGGGGGSTPASSARYGACGGGGGIAEGYFDVTPGVTYTGVVGAGGAGQTSTAGGVGQPGGTSALYTFMGATGGGGGLGQGSSTLRGGISGYGYSGQINGGLGDGSTGGMVDPVNAVLSAPGTGGGPGGQSGYGSGNPGFPGRGPGGGGGGTSYCEIGSQGGNGSAGLVTIEY